MKSSVGSRLARFRSRRGLASALIIMLLVLLVFFGVLSLVTTAADYRLSQKRADWNAGYYQADSDAVQVLAAIDAYCKGLEGDRLSEGPLAESLGSWLGNAPNVQEVQIEVVSTGTPALLLDVLVARDSESGQGIRVRLRIRTGQVQPGEQRITVEKWSQWQPEFDYSGTEGGIWKG